VIAATAGLLLVYGLIFALEGMTTRLPITTVKELGLTSLWTTPWMLLFFSGVEDLSIAARKGVVLGAGILAALLFLFYFDRYTSLSVVTKVASPLIAVIAVIAGALPHFVRQIRFLFVLYSITAAIAGALVLYYVTPTLLSPSTHFATKTIGLLIVTFCLSSILAAGLVVYDLYSKVATPRHA
jgi:hypothetical protein